MANFPLKERSRAALNKLAIVTARRKVEMRELEVSHEGGLGGGNELGHVVGTGKVNQAGSFEERRCGERKMNHEGLFEMSCGERKMNHEGLFEMSCGERKRNHEGLFEVSYGDRKINHEGCLT